MIKNKIQGISLFSGAGGMDVGFQRAGVKVIWANEINKDAYETYKANNPDTIMVNDDIQNISHSLEKYQGVDILFGGPPCQGFSVAGKMDPLDERSKMIEVFLDVVDIIKPRSFVIENVKALAKLEKWKSVRKRIFERSLEMGYDCKPFVLNSSQFGVPQKRERVFFIGLLNKKVDYDLLLSRFNSKMAEHKTVRQTIECLGPAGTQRNPLTCTAKITLAANPILRKSPYAGMIFNGMGRPLNLDGASNTLPASMGGNKTPVIDESLLYDETRDNWIVEYHRKLIEKQIDPTYEVAPSRLRRLTTKEAALIQTFPPDYKFCGSKTAVYKQIGNAVPCKLAEVVAEVVIEELTNKTCKNFEEGYQKQLSMDDVNENQNSVLSC